MSGKNPIISLDNSTFFKLRKLYLLAILLIAATIVVAQILIQKHLDSQLNDSRIVNIAGRQRMLSQKLVKQVFILKDVKTKKERISRNNVIKADNQTFLNSHKDLQIEFSEFKELLNSDSEFKEVFYQMENYHKRIVNTCNDIVNLVEINPLVPSDSIYKHIIKLENVEDHFLVKMNEIVFKYDKVSQQKVESLKHKEYILFVIALLILLLEMLFLFKPISIQIKKIIGDLISAKKEAQIKTKKVEELLIAKEISLQELKGLNYALNNAALFASVTQDGSIVHLSKKFSKLLEVNKQDVKIPLEELLMLDEGEQKTIQEILKGKRRSIWVGEVQVTTKSNEKIWLEMSVIPMHLVKIDQRVLVLCNDITKRKESQLKIDQLNEERFKEQVNLQKIQASQIVEAQEEERKRIAKDIHDGIGQMLTALKFNIESINSQNVESTSEKVQKLKEMLANLIKEVRAVTFNLTPPELSDYGIVPTLNKLADKLATFTGKKIYFENKTNFKGRFDSLVETNLYRVVQEAVNNALKYANSNYILISISHSEQFLSIVIDDDGKGFDVQKLMEAKGDAGMGLFFMKERISYINGRIFINSTKNKGTRITINVNLEQL